MTGAAYENDAVVMQGAHLALLCFSCSKDEVSKVRCVLTTCDGEIIRTAHHNDDQTDITASKGSNIFTSPSKSPFVSSIHIESSTRAGKVAQDRNSICKD